MANLVHLTVYFIALHDTFLINFCLATNSPATGGTHLLIIIDLINNYIASGIGR